MRGPSGNRFRGVRAPVPPIAFVANTAQRVEIPNVLLGRNLALRVTGNLVIATANATVFAEAPLSLIRSIAVVCDGTTKTLMSASGAMHFRAAHYIRHKLGELVAPSGTVGTRAFAMTILLDHEAWRMGDPSETLFDGRRFKKVELVIEWGSETSIATAGGGGTIALSAVTSDIFATQVNVGAKQIAYDRIISQDTIAVTATNTRFDLKLPQAGILLGILFRCTRDAGGGAGPVLVDDLIRSITLYSDTTLRHDETLAWATLQRANVQDYQLDGGPAAGLPMVGYNFLDRVENGSFASALNVNALNETKLRLDILRTSGTELIEILYEFAEPLPVAA